MKFQKFLILDSRSSQTPGGGEVEMLLNLDHIISIKPIRISSPDKLMNGFWIRTTNGKKYRATKIPDELLSIIGEKYQGPVMINMDLDEQQPFQ